MFAEWIPSVLRSRTGYIDWKITHPADLSLKMLIQSRIPVIAPPLSARRLPTKLRAGDSADPRIELVLDPHGLAGEESR